MNLSLIIAPYFLRHLRLLPPYGVSCLAAYLTQHGHIVTVHDLAIEEKLFQKDINSIFKKKLFNALYQYLVHDKKHPVIDALTQKMSRFITCNDQDLFGFSILSSWGLPATLLLAKEIKRKTRKPIVFGGPVMTEYACSSDREKLDLLFRDYPFIDYVIYGDGGVSLLQLIEHTQGKRRIEDSHNIIYRNEQSYSINERTFFPLHDVPLPDYSVISLDRYRMLQQEQADKNIIGINSAVQLPYQLTRGCPHQCSFCNYHVIDPYVETKPYSLVLQELRILKELYGTNHFYFCECKINISYEYINTLCDHFINVGLLLQWFSSASITACDYTVLQKMKQAGCYGLAFGVESGSNKMLRVMNKDTSVMEVSSVLKMAHDVGIKTIVSFITGFVGETEDDLEQTCTFIKQNVDNIDKVIIHKFMLVPDSPLARQPEFYGLKNIFYDYHFPVGYQHMSFDEQGGLTWKKKVRQQERFYKQLKKTVSKHFAQTR